MVDSFEKSIEVATKLRTEGINTQIYTNQDKIKKQFQYANKLNIPYVIVIGEDEIKDNKVSLKDMISGEQKEISIEEAIKIINGVQ